MKLIRLTTTNNRAIFDNNFNADITIPKNSKVALQNLSIESPNSILVINSTNNKIYYEISSAGNTLIELPFGQFDKSNYETLFRNISHSLNNNTGFIDVNNINNRREFGLEWRCRKDTNNKVNIQYQIGKYLSYKELKTQWINANNKVRIVDSGNGTYSSNTGNPPTNTVDNNIFLKNFIARGCGFLRARVNKLVNGTDEDKSGFTIGLTSKNMLNLSNQDLEQNDLTYGLRVKLVNKGQPNEQFNYFTVLNGVETDTGQKVQQYINNDKDNDYLEVTINSGKIYFRKYDKDNGQTPEELGDVPYTAGQELFPFIIFYADKDNCEANGVTYTESPYSSNPTLHTINEPELGIGLSNPPVPTRPKYPNFLQFQSIQVAEFLGFKNTRYPIVGGISAVEYNWVADRLFTATTLADAFIVLLDNIPLESYDGFTNSRKNILAIVPQSNENGNVIYEPSTPYFIDIKNANDLLLRQIKARIVLPDYSEMDMEGLATLTILIS